MKIIKKIATVVGFIVIALVIIGAVAGGSGKKKSDSASSQETVQASDSKAEEKVEQKAEEEKKPADTSAAEASSSGETPDSKYSVSIDNATVGTDYAGEPCVFVTYTFTNVSDDDPTSFGWSLISEVYQNGVQCETAIADIEGDSNYTTKVKMGNSIAVTQAYKLQDTTTDVEVEVKELISFDKKVLAKQVFTIA